MNIIRVQGKTMEMHLKERLPALLPLIEVIALRCEIKLAMSIANQQKQSITSTENMTKAHFLVVHYCSSVHCVNKVKRRNFPNFLRVIFLCFSFEFCSIFLALPFTLCFRFSYNIHSRFYIVDSRRRVGDAIGANCTNLRHNHRHKSNIFRQTTVMHTVCASIKFSSS